MTLLVRAHQVSQLKPVHQEQMSAIQHHAEMEETVLIYIWIMPVLVLWDLLVKTAP
jgi:hypothetical protein